MKVRYIFRPVGLIFLCLLISFFPCQGQTKEQATYTLSDQDAETINSILKYALGGMDTISNEMHTDFWHIVNKYGGRIEDIQRLGTKKKLLDFIEETGMKYQRSFYEDALISFRTRKPFESKKRKELNKKLNIDRIEKNALLMEKIANQTPVPYHEGEIVFDEEMIIGVLENLDATFDLFNYNLEILYSKTY